MACLFSVARRNLSPKWLYKTSRPVLLHYIKDYTESSVLDSNLPIRRFHRKIFFQDETKVSFVQPMGSGVLLCSHMSSSSSSSCKPEESYIKINDFGKVVEELAPEKSVESVATTVSTIDECSAAIENFSCPEDYVQYVINGIHELTGLNWWMSIVLTAFLVNGLMSPIQMWIEIHRFELQILLRGIQKVKRIIKIGDPKTLAKSKKWQAELMNRFEDAALFFLLLFLLDVLIYISFINGISTMAKKIPAFESGGILWFTDLSTPDSFYILPLVTGFIFWLTSEIHINQPNLESRMKTLPLFLIFFTVLQAPYGFESAVYVYLIPSRISVSAFLLMMRSKQIVNIRRIMGWPDVPVTKGSEKKRIMARVVSPVTKVSEQKRIMARWLSLMKEFIDVVTKKDNK